MKLVNNESSLKLLGFVQYLFKADPTPYQNGSFSFISNLLLLPPFFQNLAHLLPHLLRLHRHFRLLAS